MRSIIFEDNTKYDIAILIKNSGLKEDKLIEHYINPSNIDPSNFIAFSLDYNKQGKCPIKLLRSCLDKTLKALDVLGVTTIYICDGPYFKTLTKSKKAEPHLGYILPCTIDGYEHMQVILGANYSNIHFNPDVIDKIDLSIKTLSNHYQGIHIDLGTTIIHSEYYPDTINKIQQTLKELHQYDELVCDIETFSLKHIYAGIGTIAFAWDQHNGIAFSCDYAPYMTSEGPYKNVFGHWGIYRKNLKVRLMILDFLLTYKGNLKFHNATFDIKILIYTLWMETIIDHKGLIDGLEVMTKNFDCTKLITYLATNNCVGNHLSLKAVAHEFAGNYAEDDIKNIKKIPLDKLLRYNLVDCLSTWFTHTKNRPILITDKQEHFYLNIGKESLVTLIQMELTGMPILMPKVLEAEIELTDISQGHLNEISKSDAVKDTCVLLRTRFLHKDFNDRKDKAKNPDKIKPKLLEDIDWEFNPGSPKQVATLLYDHLELPILDTTDTGLPATGAKEIKKLKSKTTSQVIKDLIDALRGYAKANKILSTFIPAFKKAELGPDGIYYLFGNFNFGGAVTGRMSSSDPNLQNIPSNSTYAKIIKKCFGGNLDWIFAGADFASLEDYVSALTTGDPNKLKVYLDGYDGHSLRAFTYFPKEMPDIINTVDSINSIKTKYPHLRQDSKAPTFALTYQGMWITLMNNLGWSEQKAKRIEKNYHDLYKVSDQWVQDRLKEASKDGYVTLAFGLRLRTPILAKVVFNTRSTPYQAKAEGRTAGNALGQSYGLLTNRAANEFMKRVRASKYKYDIKLCAMIHDAIYPLIRNKVNIIHWVNKNLTECMAWQDLPELQHDKVKIHAEMDLFHPDWSKSTELPNNATKAEIIQICRGN